MRHVLFGLSLLLTNSAASAGPMLSFERVGSPNAAEDVASQLRAYVTDDGSLPDVGTATTASFKFFNIGSIASFIGQIQFDQSMPLFDFSTVLIDGSHPGVDFEIVNPVGVPNPSSGIAFDADYTVGKNGGAANGVNNGSGEDTAEWLSITFNLVSGKTYSNVLQELGRGNVRLAMHLQSIGVEGKSDKFVSLPTASGGDTPTVPEPGTLTLLALGAVGLGGLGWRRRMTAAA